MAGLFQRESKIGRPIGKEIKLEFPASGASVRIVKLGDGTELLCEDGAVVPLNGAVSVIEGASSEKVVTTERINLENLSSEYIISVVDRKSLDGRKVAAVRATQTALPWND